MSYLHSNEILHRDLTTENVFVDRNFYPKLTNIDMINIFKGLKSMKRILNLSFYQAPEFYFEDKYSKLSDVYSFALMVYEILSNENLFIKISFTNHLENMKNMWRPSLDKKIPEAYHSLINKCWSQNPSERPSFEMILNLLKLDVKQKIKNFEIDKFNDYINIVDSSQKETKQGNSSNENARKNTKTKIKKDDDDDDDGNNEEEESKKDGDDEDDGEESIKDGDEEEEEEEFVEEEELNEFEKKICEDLLNEKVNRINIKLYKKGKIIDNGGFGTVYKATKIKERQRKFAAKVFSLRNSFDDPKIYKNFCKTFMNEMILHSNFSHPSVVKFIGYSPLNFTNADNRHKPLMMMDFVQKGSLHSIIQKVKKGIKIEGWDDTKRLIIIYGIAASMSYLHSKDILHRDLKLRNVLIDNDFYPKLTDFGLSIEISKISGEKEKCVKGTANYIAPEIWKDINYSKSSDVYSFAILVYELVTNNFLFENARDEFICYQITIGKFRPKIDNRKISKSYIQLINLCWSDDANERPSFDSILKMLKEDDGFTKDNVDVVAFKEYISFIDKQLNSSNI